MTKYLFLLATSLISSVPCFSQEGVEDLFLQTKELDRVALIQAVLDRNPNLEFARLAWQGLQEEIPQVKSFDDPVVSYSVAPASLKGSRFGQVFEVKQKIPFFGKRSLREEIARGNAMTANYQFEASKKHMALLASFLFDDYVLAARHLTINKEHQVLLMELKQSAESNYASGQASQQDPIQADVELAQLEKNRIVLEAGRNIVVARLNQLLHRPAHLPLPTPVSKTPKLERKLSSSTRSEVFEHRARIKAAEAKIRLTKREFIPDFSINTKYNSLWKNEDYRFMIGASVPLPVHRRKLNASLRQSESRLEQERKAYSATLDMIANQVEESKQLLMESSKTLKLYTARLLPAASDRIEAASAGYISGTNNFLTLIDAERHLRMIQFEYHTALAKYHKRLARWKYAHGHQPGTNLQEEKNEN